LRTPEIGGAKAQGLRRTTALLSLRLIDFAPLREMLLLFREYFTPSCAVGYGLSLLSKIIGSPSSTHCKERV
jgi:hypothetical protein